MVPGHNALKKIVSDKRFEISFIVPRFDNQDPVLKEWANRLSIDYLPTQNVNSTEAIKKFLSYGPDIFVSMSFNQILKNNILESVPHGIIKCHAGLLPFYRGRNVLNWALINDEKEFGITVHYIDEGIDTGDIIRQQKLPISDRDNYATLLNAAIKKCGQLLYTSLVDIRNGSVKRIKQKDIHLVGSYFGRRRDGDEWIDWNWTSRRIFNFVRAITSPGPCARAILGERTMLIREVSLIESAPEYLSTPGEIIGRKNNCYIIKTGDTSLLIERYQFESMAEQNSSIESKIGIGMRFQANPYAVKRNIQDG